MISSYEEAFLVILLLEAVAGLLSSFFMIIFLSVNEFQRKHVTTYSKILIPLNVSNMLYTSVLSVIFIIGYLSPERYNKPYVYYTSSYIILYSITSSLWLAAGLCLFYFIKITPPQPGVLTTLKSRIGAIVWWLIIMAEVVSLGGSFLSMLLSFPHNIHRNSSIILSERIEMTNAQNVSFFSFVLILNSLPFLVIMMTTIGIAWFLKMYNCQIQKNLGTSGNTRVRDYRAAIQTMIELLAMYALILACIIIFTLKVFSYPALGYWICMMFLFSFATVLSSIIIHGNPKLRETLKNSLLCK